MQSQPKRKRRCDRNHILYIATAPNGESYIGLTVVEGTPQQSMRRRWLKHVNRAKCEGLDWTLCRAIRQVGSDAFELRILERVRGKAAAHQREVELIAEHRPRLNTARTGRST